MKKAGVQIDLAEPGAGEGDPEQGAAVIQAWVRDANDKRKHRRCHVLHEFHEELKRVAAGNKAQPWRTARRRARRRGLGDPVCADAESRSPTWCSRYLFNWPLRGAFEATELMLLVLIFAGLPLVSHADEHVTMDFIDRMLTPPRHRGAGARGARSLRRSDVLPGVAGLDQGRAHRRLRRHPPTCCAFRSARSCISWRR